MLARRTTAVHPSVSVAQWPPPERSGDIVEIARHEDGALTVVVADVCGNGLAAVALGRQVRKQVRAALLAFRAPDVLLALLGDLLQPLTPLDAFVAALVLHIEADGRTLHMATAGHIGPFVRRADGVEACLPVASGPPLGIFKGSVYPVLTRTLAAGDAVVCVTDGVSDHFASDDDATGADGLRQRLRARAANDVCKELIAAVSPLTSDATVVAVHIDAGAATPNQERRHGHKPEQKRGLAEGRPSHEWAHAFASAGRTDRGWDLHGLSHPWGAASASDAIDGRTLRTG
ncbi:MAG TPA: PP2C family protein-serine/threonine phosphatase [Polyangia bacterium]